MSSAINVDKIAPKNASVIRLDCRSTSKAGVILQPYTVAVSAPVSVGALAGVATQTGTITLDGGVWYLNLNTFTLPSTNAYAGSVATCPLLAGTLAIPTENKLFNAMMSENGTSVLGAIKIGTTGTLTYYEAVAGTGWTSSQTGIVYNRVLKYVA